ncbi:MAG: DUF937 domain-containing protein, partial [Deinococcus sp.]|nr:DUF937 domain-containing protein [Deinococcus sp.]
MELLQLLAGQMQAQQVSQRVGASPEQTQDALQAAVPLLLGALTRNAQQGQAAAIEQAVAQHGEQDLEGFARAGQLPDMQDGQAALRHIFGGQQQAAANALGRRSGIDPQLALQILSIAAPLVLSYLNRQRQGAEMGGQPAGFPGGLPGGLPSGVPGQVGMGLPGAAAPAGGDITSVLTSVLGGLLGGGVTTTGGITQEYITAGRGKDVGNPFRPLTDEERADLQTFIDQEYRSFVNHVATARDIDPAVLTDQLGAVMLGTERAQQVGYIDGVMGRPEAFAHFAESSGLDAQQTKVVQAVSPSPWGSLFG